MGTETRRAAVTAVAGLMALGFPGAIASDLADAALVDLGALVECDAQETVCPEALGYLSPQQPDLHMTHAGVPSQKAAVFTSGYAEPAIVLDLRRYMAQEALGSVPS